MTNRVYAPYRSHKCLDDVLGPTTINRFASKFPTFSDKRLRSVHLLIAGPQLSKVLRECFCEVSGARLAIRHIAYYRPLPS